MSSGLTSILLDHYRVHTAEPLPPSRNSPEPSSLRLLSDSSESLLCSGTPQAPRLLSGPDLQAEERHAAPGCTASPGKLAHCQGFSCALYSEGPLSTSPGVQICIFQSPRNQKHGHPLGLVETHRYPGPLPGFLNANRCFP